jgi:shikimate dehydrogenase
LVYNPSKTHLLLEAEKRGASIKNGLEMLELQAEKSFEIWEDSKIK